MNYIELEVWKEARVLVKTIYKLTKSFPDTEKFGLNHKFKERLFQFRQILQKVVEDKAEKIPFVSFILPEVLYMN